MVRITSTSASSLGTSIGTAEIDDLAVTTAKIAASAVTTAKIAAGAVMVANPFELSSSFSTSSTSYVDTGLTVTFTPATACSILIMLTFCTENGTANAENSFNVLLDGSSVTSNTDAIRVMPSSTGGNRGSCAFQQIKTSVSAASHTVKVQMKVSAGSGTIGGTMSSLLNVIQILNV